MDCKKHVSSNSTFVKVNESSMYRDMGLAPAQSGVETMPPFRLNNCS